MGKDGFRVPEIIRDIPQVTAAALSPDEMGEIIGNCVENLPEMKKRALAANLQGLTSLQCEQMLAGKNGLWLGFRRGRRAL
jgi:hypothetical protein